MQAMEAHGDKLDPAAVTIYPCVVPERGVSDETMDKAVAMLNAAADRKRDARESAPPPQSAGGPSGAKKKPWWKFW